jgi:ribonuclease PH
MAAQVAAVSVGLVDGVELLDLCYEEDSNAMVDLNVVMTDKGELVEVQGTGEEKPFGRDKLDAMLDLAGPGVAQIIELQNKALG